MLMAARRSMVADVDLVEAARTSRRAGLIALRDLLAVELGGLGHSAGCSCECGAAGDGRVVAAVAKQFAAVMAELDGLPGVVPGEASAVVSLAAKLARKREEMGRDSASAV